MLHDPCCCCFCCLSALYADADIRKKKQTEICLNEEAIVAATHTHDDVSIKSTDKRETHRACLSKHSESAYKLRCIVCGTINSCGRILLLAGYLFFFSSSFFFACILACVASAQHWNINHIWTIALSACICCTIFFDATAADAGEYLWDGQPKAIDGRLNAFFRKTANKKIWLRQILGGVCATSARCQWWTRPREPKKKQKAHINGIVLLQATTMATILQYLSCGQR